MSALLESLSGHARRTECFAHDAADAALDAVNPNPVLAAAGQMIDRAAARLPNVKAPVDLLLMVENYGNAMRKVEVPRGGRAEYFDDRDAPDMGPIIEEIERLQCAEFDRGVVMATTTAVLLVLSKLQAAGAITAMGPEAVAAVEAFSKACAEVAA